MAIDFTIPTLHPKHNVSQVAAHPATVWRAPRFATEGGQLAAGVVQCAILDLKEAEFGWQRELVTTKKCEFSYGKINDSIVFA